jgi:hypothetical protein
MAKDELKNLGFGEEKEVAQRETPEKGVKGELRW